MYIRSRVGILDSLFVFLHSARKDKDYFRNFQIVEAKKRETGETVTTRRITGTGF